MQQVLDAREMRRHIREMAEKAAEMVGSPKNLVLVGIRTHGVNVARRIRSVLKESKGWDVPLGILDITFYRDDLSRLDQQPIARPTQLEFDITGRVVLLVDDVLYTGRTVRCALDQIMDFGRPRAVRLAVLVDRGPRELPIQADIVGLSQETAPGQKVEVRFGENENEDGVWVG